MAGKIELYIRGGGVVARASRAPIATDDRQQAAARLPLSSDRRLSCGHIYIAALSLIWLVLLVSLPSMPARQRVLVTVGGGYRLAYPGGRRRPCRIDISL